MVNDEARHDDRKASIMASSDSASIRLRELRTNLEGLRARRDALAAQLDSAAGIGHTASSSRIERLLEYEALLLELRVAEQALADAITISDRSADGRLYEAAAPDSGQALSVERARAQASLASMRAQDAEEEMRQLHRVRGAITGGRRFREDSTEILRDVREGWSERT